MFGPSKEQIVAEVREQLKNELEQVKKQYIFEIESTERRCKELMERSEELIRTAEKISEQNERLTALLEEKQPGLVRTMKMEDELASMKESIEELKAGLAKKSEYIPPAESEYAQLLFLQH